MNKFKIGDRVRITKPFLAMQLVGAKAVVVVDELGWYGLDIEGWAHGHNCGGVLDEHCVSGYWVKAGYFEKVSTFKGNK